MLKNNPYRRLTIELKILSEQLNTNSVTPEEAQSMLDGILDEFDKMECKDTEIDRNELIEMFFPQMNLI